MEESNRNQNKIWVDKGRKFYNRSMKSRLEKDPIAMYPTQNEEKSIFTERFVRTLKNQDLKYMTSISKMCILIN